MYGNPEVTTGGRALKFYSSVRIEVRRRENLKNGTEVYGSRTKCKVVKNKVAPPFKVAEFDIIYGKGISKVTEIIDLAMEMGIVERSGAWFYYEGNRIGQGKEAAKKYIEDNPELLKELEDKLKKMKDQIDIKEEPAGLADEDEDGEEFDISLLGLSDD